MKHNQKRLELIFSKLNTLTSSGVIRHVTVVVHVIGSSVTTVMTMFMLVVFLVAVGVVVGDFRLGDDLVCGGLVFAMTLESHQG